MADYGQRLGAGSFGLWQIIEPGRGWPMTVPTAGKPATLVQVKTYFGYTNTKQFSTEWAALSPESQAQIKAGIGNGTLDY